MWIPIYLSYYLKYIVCYGCSVSQLCLTLCNPLDCGPPGSSILGILQAGILEWVTIPFSRGPSDPGIKPVSPDYYTVGRFFTTEPVGKPALHLYFHLLHKCHCMGRFSLTIIYKTGLPLPPDLTPEICLCLLTVPHSNFKFHVYFIH